MKQFLYSTSFSKVTSSQLNLSLNKKMVDRGNFYLMEEMVSQKQNIEYLKYLWKLTSNLNEYISTDVLENIFRSGKCLSMPIEAHQPLRPGY